MIDYSKVDVAELKAECRKKRLDPYLPIAKLMQALQNYDNDSPAPPTTLGRITMDVVKATDYNLYLCYQLEDEGVARGINMDCPDRTEKKLAHIEKLLLYDEGLFSHKSRALTQHNDVDGIKRRAMVEELIAFAVLKNKVHFRAKLEQIELAQSSECDIERARILKEGVQKREMTEILLAKESQQRLKQKPAVASKTKTYIFLDLKDLHFNGDIVGAINGLLPQTYHTDFGMDGTRLFIFFVDTAKGKHQANNLYHTLVKTSLEAFGVQLHPQLFIPKDASSVNDPMTASVRGEDGLGGSPQATKRSGEPFVKPQTKKAKAVQKVPGSGDATDAVKKTPVATGAQAPTRETASNIPITAPEVPQSRGSMIQNTPATSSSIVQPRETAPSSHTTRPQPAQDYSPIDTAPTSKKIEAGPKESTHYKGRLRYSGPEYEDDAYAYQIKQDLFDTPHVIIRRLQKGTQRYGGVIVKASHETIRQMHMYLPQENLRRLVADDNGLIYVSFFDTPAGEKSAEDFFNKGDETFRHPRLVTYHGQQRETYAKFWKSTIIFEYDHFPTVRHRQSLSVSKG